MTTIIELAELYISQHDISEGHADQIRIHSSLYAGDMSPFGINAEIKRMRAAGLSDSYIKQRRSYVLMLWRFAASRELAADPPMSKIARVRVRDLVVEAYRIDQVQKIIQTCRGLRGTYACGTRKAIWWESIVRGAWDTGLSVVADLVRVKRSMLDDRNEFVTTRRKTGKRVRVGFHASTMKYIDQACHGNRDLIWPMSVSKESVRKAFRRIARKAGVGGTLKWLRAGSGTNVDQRVGHGELHLGNTRTVFDRHYNAAPLKCRFPDELPD